jgi:hypothetical protein
VHTSEVFEVGDRVVFAGDASDRHWTGESGGRLTPPVGALGTVARVTTPIDRTVLVVWDADPDDTRLNWGTAISEERLRLVARRRALPNG